MRFQGNTTRRALFAALLLSTACGGGSSKEPDFTIDSEVVSFSGEVSDAQPPAPKVVTGSIQNVTASVFLFVEIARQALETATFEQTGERTGRLTLFPKAPGLLGPGSFTETVTVRACLDDRCVQQVSGSPRHVTVTYVVTGLSASPPSVALTAIEGDTSAPSAVAVGNGSGVAAWSTSVAYAGQSTGWLAVTPASGTGTSASLEITGGPLPPGVHEATLTVTAGPLQRAVPVTYTVSPNLTADAAGVEFAAVTGQPAVPASQSVQLSTARPGLVTVATSVSYAAGEPQGWLSVSGGTAPGTVVMVPTTTSLAPGASYHATVVVTPANGSAAASFPVVYTLTPAILSVDAATVEFAAITGQPALPGSRSASLSTAGSAPLAFVTSVSYAAGEPQGWLSVSGDTAPGTVVVVPTTTSLAPGASYHATVVVTPANGTAAVSFPVVYALSASVLEVAPSSVTFAVDAGTAPGSAALARTVATSDTGAALTWTATSSAPWLAVSPAGASGGSVTLAVIPAALAALANGTSRAEVVFTYAGPGVVGATRTLPVSLDLALPRVDFVAHYVAYTGEQLEVVVRGKGFLQASLPPVLFGGEPAATVTVRGDTELRAVPPPLAAGRHRVTISNALALDLSRPELVVRERPVHVYAALGGDGTLPNGHLVHDAEHDAVLASRAWFSPEAPAATISNVIRYARDGATGAWSRTTRFFPQLLDIALGPDGHDLLVVGTSQLYLVDPVTLDTRATVDLPHSLGGTTSQLAVMNDGRVVVRDIQQAYSLLTGTFSPIFLPGGVIDASPDGSRLMMGSISNGPSEIAWYDAGPDTLSTATVAEGYFGASLSRGGSRTVIGKVVRNGSLAMIGGLPEPAGEVSPDGTRAFVPDFGPTRVRVFDLTGAGPGFPELSPITPADDPLAIRAKISLDGRTLFLFGQGFFLVLPVP